MSLTVMMTLPESQRAKVIPKLGMTLTEVEFAIGSPDVVKRMRKEGLLKACCEKPQLYDSGDVARAWARWKDLQQK